MQTYLTTKQILKQVNNEEDIKNLLLELSEADADFSGENGEDYLWDKAREASFESNAEFVADEVMRNNESVESCVNAFVQLWTGNDHYYDEVVVDIDNIDNIYAVTFSAICGS